MLKMCPKCGYFYDDTKYQQCPQCNAEVENVTSNSNAKITNTNVSNNNSSEELGEGVCKRCGGFAPYGNDYCPDCLAEMEQEEAQKIKRTIEEKTVGNDEHKCPSCGNIQSKNIARCLICGQIIDDGGINTPVQENDTNTANQIQNDISNVENEDDSAVFEETFNGNLNENTTFENGGNSSQNNEISFNNNFNSGNLATNSGQTVTQTRNNFVGNKKYIIAIVAMILVIALGAVIGATVSAQKQRKPIVIDLNNYISSNVLTNNDYEDYGYSTNDDVDSFYTNTDFGAGLIVLGTSGNGSIDGNMIKNVINWSQLKDDVNVMLKEKKKYDGRYLTFSDFFNEDSFTYDVSISEYITNGDTVTVNISPVNYTYEFNDTYIEFSETIAGYQAEYQVDSLTEIYPFDPFDYVDVIRYDTGDITLKVPETLDEYYEGVNIRYYDDNTISIGDYGNTTDISFWFVEGQWLTWVENLQSGDVVTMECSDVAGALEEGYHLSVQSCQKEYVY